MTTHNVTPVKSTRPHLSGDELAWAFVAGAGLLLVILALGINAAAIDNAIGGTLLFVGFLFFICGVAGWTLEFKPWKKFDDLKTPLYTGHVHDDHAGAHTEPDPMVMKELVETSADHHE